MTGGPIRRFSSLVTLADAYSEDPAGFNGILIVGGPTARNIERNRWYISGLAPDDEGNRETVACPERGGHAYLISDLLNDPGLREAVERTAALRDRITNTMSRDHDGE